MPVFKSDNNVSVVKVADTDKTVKTNIVPNVALINEILSISRADIAVKVVNTEYGGLGLDVTRFRFNQTPVESPDGSRTTFTLPNSEQYTTGLIEVFVDGVQKTFTEASSSTITLGFAPDANEAITMNYIT